MSGDNPADVRRYCREFAQSHPEVPVYARIAGAAAGDDLAIDLLSAAAPGQARPVLLLAALHDLVIRRPGVPAARWFVESPPAGDPWPDVRETLAAYADELRSVIAGRATQTNEVNRAGYVVPMLAAACVDLPNTPVTVLELGASAGLLLNVDRYRITVGDRTFGPDDSPVRCETAVEGRPPALEVPPIVTRAGLDRAPIGPDDTDDLRWLRACLWPEVPGRVGRFDAAVRVLQQHPPQLFAGDMVDDLATVAERVRVPGSHLVVFSSWAMTYLARDRRGALLEKLAALDGPVSLVTAEPPGCVSGLPTPSDEGVDRLVGTDVGLHRWRSGVPLPAQFLGQVHHPGAWLRWA